MSTAVNGLPPALGVTGTASEWLDSGEAAAHLKVKPRTLLLWVRQGKVPAYALSGTHRRTWRFRRAELDTALLSHPVLGSQTSSPVRSAERRKQ
jgi:excisionase family DNA binding protein